MPPKSLTELSTDRLFPSVETLNRRFLDPQLKSYHIRRHRDRIITNETLKGPEMKIELTQEQKRSLFPDIPLVQQRKKEYVNELDRIERDFGFNDLTPIDNTRLGRANPTRRRVLEHVRRQTGEGVKSLSEKATDSLFPTVSFLQQTNLDPLILRNEIKGHLRRLNNLEDSRTIPYDIPAVRQRRDEYENEIRRIGRMTLDRSTIGRNAAARAHNIIRPSGMDSVNHRLTGSGVKSLSQLSIDQILPPLTVAYTATGINNNIIRENYDNYLRLKRESQFPDIPALERRAKGYEEYIKEIDRLNVIFDRLSGRRQAGSGLGPDPSVQVVNTAQGAQNRKDINFINGAKQAVGVISDLADEIFPDVPFAGDAIGALGDLIPDTSQYEYTFEREPSTGNTAKNFVKPMSSNIYNNVFGQDFSGGGFGGDSITDFQRRARIGTIIQQTMNE